MLPPFDCVIKPDSLGNWGQSALRTLTSPNGGNSKVAAEGASHINKT